MNKEMKYYIDKLLINSKWIEDAISELKIDENDHHNSQVLEDLLDLSLEIQTQTQWLYTSVVVAEATKPEMAASS